MIEKLIARNGCPVLRYDGRLLASAHDPLLEAESWLSGRKTMLTRVKSVFVLGSGAGYHIEAICRNTPARVIVIDKDPDLADAVQSIHGFSSIQVCFESVSSAKDLRQSEIVRYAVKESFLVLEHAPSQSAHPEFFKDVHRQLLGRDWGSLNWQWQMRDFAPLDTQTKIHTDGEPLTIYDLDNTELVQDSTEREKILVKALRELVK